jgi:hypothetical protein
MSRTLPFYPMLTLSMLALGAKAAPEISGSMTRVALDGRYYLFTAEGNQSALYTP